MENENKNSAVCDADISDVSENAIADAEIADNQIDADTDYDGSAKDAADEASAPEYEPKNKYEKLLYSVYRDDTIAEIFRISSYAVVALTVYAFFARLAGLIETPIEIVKILVVTGIPFVIVSLVRILIDAPRPYEILEFYEKKPKGKAGRSFPSRHVFSVFVIATVLVTWNPLVAVGLALLGVLLAFLRVALGIHFPRDVVAGALIGIASGAVGLLALYFV